MKGLLACGSALRHKASRVALWPFIGAAVLLLLTSAVWALMGGQGLMWSVLASAPV